MRMWSSIRSTSQSSLRRSWFAVVHDAGLPKKHKPQTVQRVLPHDPPRNPALRVLWRAGRRERAQRLPGVRALVEVRHGAASEAPRRMNSPCFRVWVLFFEGFDPILLP